MTFPSKNYLNVKQETDNQVSALVVRVEHPVTRDRVTMLGGN